jgi:phage baseplate assembly protein gpV
MAENYGSEGYDPIGYNQTRFGTVTARRQGATGPEVQVTYDDRDGVITDWLPVGTKGTVGTAFFHCPRVGEQVKVSHGPTGIEQGVVESAVHSTTNPIFVPTSLDSIAMKGDDGAYFEYDPPSGILTMTGVAESHVVTKGDLLAQVGGSLKASVGGALTATVTGQATVTAQLINLNGVQIDSSGNVTIPGNLTVIGVTNLKMTFANPRAENADGSGGGS